MVLGIYLSAVWDYVWRNPTIVLVLFFLVRKLTAAAAPFPECGGRVYPAHGTNYFDEALAAASKKGNLMICDFYATWRAAGAFRDRAGEGDLPRFAGARRAARRRPSSDGSRSAGAASTSSRSTSTSARRSRSARA